MAKVLGWREWVVLPALSAVPMKAKVDTGARTSALHAFDLKIDDDASGSWAEFEVHPLQRSRASATRVTVPVLGFKQVRSSTGHSERRPVIKTVVEIGQTHYPIELTLTARDEMGFRMLLGRSAVRRRFWVDASRSYLHPVDPPPSTETRSQHE